jgi:hypothetical protein
VVTQAPLHKALLKLSMSFGMGFFVDNVKKKVHIENTMAVFDESTQEGE